MKKILFTVATLALLASVSSCTEKEMEGRYAPKEKIQTVYSEMTEYYNGSIEQQVPKYKSEEWTWEKDQLNRIVYFEPVTYQVGEEGEVEMDYEQLYGQFFTYDKDGRLTKSEIIGWVNMTTTYEYDGDYLKTMAMYQGNEMYVTCQFNHEGKKITSFDLTMSDEFFYMGKKEMRQLERVNPLAFVLSTESASKVMAATQACAKRAAKMGGKGNLVVHYDMEWAGDNVRKITASYMGITMMYAFNYDTKNNPFYNLFEPFSLDENGLMPFLPLSKNNVTGIVGIMVEDGETEQDTLTYTYTYNNKDYPSSKKVEEADDVYQYVETYYYEYK